MSESPNARFETARAAAEAGAQVAADLFRVEVVVETKTAPTDVVTRADREAQDAVVEAIRTSFPDEPIVGEEDDTPTAVPEEGPAWVVDPIDGTNNYVGKIPIWMTSVAAVVDGEPVAAVNVAPALGDTYAAGEGPATLNELQLTVSSRDSLLAASAVPTYWWDFDNRAAYAAACRGIVERFGDMRRFGSAQLCLSYVASGAVDGAVTDRQTNPWDTVAGAHLVRAAGGRVTDRHGERWRHDSEGLVASNGDPTIHEALLDVAEEAATA